MFSFKLNSLLAYETVKTVRIHDWRIGCLYWSLMACIAIYTVGYEILYEEGWRASVTSQGFTRQGIDMTYNRGTPRYCQRSNEQPRTVLPDGVTKYPCTWMDDMEMVYNRGPGFMLVSTFINQTSQTRECSPYNTSCTKLGPPPGSNWGWDSESSTGQLYVAHAEDLQIWIDHAMFAPPQFPDIHGTSRTTEGKLVDRNGDTVLVFDGKKDWLSMGQLMAAAGQSLDSRSDSVLHEAQGLTYRQTGAMMVVQVKYSNVRTGGKLKYTVHSKLVSGMSVYVEETVQDGYPTQRTLIGRSGVFIMFQVSANVGKFKFQLFLLNLVAAFALTATATLLVDGLAVWVVPQKDAYRECKYQSVSMDYTAGDDGIFGEVGKIRVNNGRELEGEGGPVERESNQMHGNMSDNSAGLEDPEGEDVSLLLKQDATDADVDGELKKNRNCFDD